MEHVIILCQNKNIIEILRKKERNKKERINNLLYVSCVCLFFIKWCIFLYFLKLYLVNLVLRSKIMKRWGNYIIMMMV